MKVAIYSRKSKFTGKGDSIENQIEMCKDYANKNFDNIEEIYIYEDEGFSGGNTDRPKFQELLKDARNKKFDALICYRLDRVSRDVADFSATIEELNDYDVDFVSIKEQFDTSTPMGRAMMYIASVFSQLERETISERIKDNMLQLATTGRWLGGVPSLGFDSKKETYLDSEYKERSLTILETNEKDMKMVKFIYDKYLKLGSIHRVRKYLIENNYKTKEYKSKKSAYYSLRVLSDILRNPAYVKANDNVVNYLESKNIEVAGKDRINNKKAILVYNKVNKKGIQRDKDEWIAAIAKHEGSIRSDKWLEVQMELDKNSKTITRSGTSEVAMLSGIIRCAKCGSAMNVMYGRPRKDGTAPHYYLCDLKRLDKNKCNNSNANGYDIDTTVINKILEIAKNKDMLLCELEALKEENDSTDRVDILNTLQEKEKALLEEINNLVCELSKSEIASKYILPQIEAKDKELKELQDQIKKLEESKDKKDIENNNLNFVVKNIIQFSIIMETLENKHKKYFVQTIIDKVFWDGEDAIVKIILFAVDTESYKHSSTSSWACNSTGIILYDKVDNLSRFYDYPESNLGERIRKQRFIKGYTAKELAVICGLKEGTIYHYESNLGEPSAYIMNRIVDALDINVDYFEDGYYSFVLSSDYTDYLKNWRKGNFRSVEDFNSKMNISYGQYTKWENGDLMTRDSFVKIKEIIK